VTFDSYFVGSLPCMPAPRDLHTDRLNFMHRSWGARSSRSTIPSRSRPLQGGRPRAAADREDVIAACGTLHNPPRSYGAVFRGEKGNSIRYDWMPFMLGAGASVAKDPPASDYTAAERRSRGRSRRERRRLATRLLRW
jgi:hypothetical protein